MLMSKERISEKEEVEEVKKEVGKNSAFDRSCQPVNGPIDQTGYKGEKDKREIRLRPHRARLAR